MAATGIVSGRRIGCDADAGKLTIEPLRAPFVGFMVLAAITPCAIAWSRARGAQLTTAGWVIMFAYAVVAVVLLVRIVLAPPRVFVDFEGKRVWIGREEFAFADVKVDLFEMASAGGGRERQRSVASLRVKARVVPLFDLTGKAAAIPPAFAAAMRGEPIGPLEHEVGHVGTEQIKAMIMRLAIVVAPGLLFAYAAVF